MRILVATDAWHPQINGVVRALEQTAWAAAKLGVEFVFLSPDRFRTVPMPLYREISVAITTPAAIGRAIEQHRPYGIHIATEGPIGWLARRWCMANARRFTTSFTTRFPEYLAARLPIPMMWSYAVLRRFHSSAAVTMVSTTTLMDELAAKGFTNLGLWTRGVDTNLFKPDRAIDLGLPRPIFVTVGRLAVEKNLEAFLSLNLPGSKVVIGKGPQGDELRRRFPEAHFLGPLAPQAVAAHVAAADVFVFPSRTDTFGNVQLEALACGVPVAAFPVPGPLDVIGSHPVGVLHEDLGTACVRALNISREACRTFALGRSWDVCAAQFVGHVKPISGNGAPGLRPNEYALS